MGEAGLVLVVGSHRQEQVGISAPLGELLHQRKKGRFWRRRHSCLVCWYRKPSFCPEATVLKVVLVELRPMRDWSLKQHGCWSLTPGHRFWLGPLVRLCSLC